MMFKVRSKRSGEMRTVYAVSNHYDHFLMYKDGGWVWEPFFYYEPLEEDKHG